MISDFTRDGFPEPDPASGPPSGSDESVDDSATGPVDRLLSREKLRYVAAADVAAVTTGTPLRAVLERLRGAASRGAVAVLSESSPHRVVGIFTERDYLDKLAGVPTDLERPIDDLMTRDPQVVSPNDPLSTAVRLMTDGGYRHLPVVDQDEFVGLVSTTDLVELLAEFFPVEVYNLPPRLRGGGTFDTREGG